ncbi:copper chaperone PCu(A)C [Thiosulfatihalobacter marinus]|uniref:copper chaperone PCu(A)C n=1 Tax=Thiosulfatihalobacter marinus TaxID=2792481 RepID=UPI0018D771A0|nr:copper chaperone PCu(A)C [Thiosulfatihalobacter marinus]
MSLKTLAIAAIGAVAFALPGLAQSVISVEDAYARASSPIAKSGAAFMVINNSGDEADRLIGVRTDIARKAELHTHIDDGNGNMSMRKVEGGFVVPANGAHVLKRGGDHVMMMGLTGPLNHGDILRMTLVFEQAGAIDLEVPVDLERKPVHGMKSMQGQMNTGG